MNEDTTENTRPPRAWEYRPLAEAIDESIARLERIRRTMRRATAATSRDEQTDQALEVHADVLALELDATRVAHLYSTLDPLTSEED